MCGLLGIVRRNGVRLTDEDLAAARDALGTLTHRGPDQWGEWYEENVYLGHRRLSILDTSEAGRQPLCTSEGDLLATVNGEIYNYQKLLSRMPPVRTSSRSDSEIVLHGYRAWGIEGLAQRLEGMYALALFDKRTRMVHLLRDRVGIKPLFFGQFLHHIVWASELKAITRFASHTSARRELVEDATALYDFLTYRYIPSPKTLYTRVEKIEPASLVSISASDSEIVSRRRYWSLEPVLERSDRETRSDAECAATVRDLLSESIKEQLVSDVPVGFFLSGGVDSSALVALAAQGGITPNTFSIGFPAPFGDETAYAAMVANRYRTAHNVQIVNEAHTVDFLERMSKWYDEPFGDTSALPTYEISRVAREHVTVALSGDGGDELFGGYSWYRRFRRFSRLHPSFLRFLGEDLRLPFVRPARRPLSKVLNRVALLGQLDPLRLYSSLLPNLTQYERRRWRHRLEIPADYDDMWSFRRYWRPKAGRYRSLQFLDFHTFLADDILTKVDRVSMAVSLEVRVPFLSTPMIEAAFSLPEAFVYRGGALKGGLKFSVEKDLPREVLERSKKGFRPPAAFWESRPGETFQERYLEWWVGGHAH